MLVEFDCLTDELLPGDVVVWCDGSEDEVTEVHPPHPGEVTVRVDVARFWPSDPDREQGLPEVWWAGWLSSHRVRREVFQAGDGSLVPVNYVPSHYAKKDGE